MENLAAVLAVVTEYCKLDVLYLDNHLLVVNKKAGQLIQGDRSGDPDLVNEAKVFIAREFNKPGNVFVGLVHRLDRPVSGVVVLARTSKAASRLVEQFRQRTVEKQYLALVEGRLIDSGAIKSDLLKEGTRVRQVKPGTPGAKEAELRYEPIGVIGKRTLVRVFPITGRPHQIRVQLSDLGYPIVGDMKYRATEEFDGKNLALHCQRMTLDHPVAKDRRSWSAPLPSSWPAEIAALID